MPLALPFGKKRLRIDFGEMRSTVAIVTVSLAGLYVALRGFWGVPAIIAGEPQGLVFLGLFASGIAMIAYREPLARWLVSGRGGDSGAISVAIVRVIGLFLLTYAIREIPAAIQALNMPAFMGRGRVILASEIVAIASAVMFLWRATVIVTWLDVAPAVDADAVRLQSILFGVVALWILITDVPELAMTLNPVYDDLQGRLDIPFTSDAVRRATVLII